MNVTNAVYVAVVGDNSFFVTLDVPLDIFTLIVILRPRILKFEMFKGKSKLHTIEYTCVI